MGVGCRPLVAGAGPGACADVDAGGGGALVAGPLEAALFWPWPQAASNIASTPIQTPRWPGFQAGCLFMIHLLEVECMSFHCDARNASIVRILPCHPSPDRRTRSGSAPVSV
jgi:hypothetical protein